LENARRERWQLALDDFSAADAIMHSPVFGLYVARCLQKLGRWVEALATYQTLTGERFPDTGPEPWQQAYRTAEVEQAELGVAIPRLQLQLAAGTKKIPSAKVDGKVVHFEAGIATLTLDPGTHTLAVSRTNGKPLETRQLDLQPSQEVHVVTLGPYAPEKIDGDTESPPSTLSTATQSTARSTTTVPPPPAGKGSTGSTMRDVGAVALGVGFLGLTVGAITGAFAWHERNAISAQCDNWECPKELSPRIERGRLLANSATVAFATAAVGLTAAGVLLYFSPRTSDRRSGALKSHGLELGITGRF
jgi:hypothetical protein